MGKTEKLRGILVFGANGSGKTTLAREFARLLQYQHMNRRMGKNTALPSGSS